MRTIKFRGKDEQGKWHFGFLITMYNNDGELCYFIFKGDKSELQNVEPWDDFILVKPDTVGQFTGLLDKNDNEIFEGDFVKFVFKKCNMDTFVVGFEDSNCGGFSLLAIDDFPYYFWDTFGHYSEYIPYRCEVIGNIHDNKELIKEK